MQETASGFARFLAAQEMSMTDPRTPQTREAQWPDPLDQNPDAHPPHEREASPDAEVLAGAGEDEGDVEQTAAAAGEATP